MAFTDEDPQGALTQAQSSLGQDPTMGEENDSADESIFGPGTSAPQLSSTFRGTNRQFLKYALEDRANAQAATQRQAAAGKGMIDAMNNATQRLQGLPFGPSPAEKALSFGAAIGQNTKTGRFGETLANGVGAMAQSAAEERKAEIQKRMLLAQYGIQTAGAQMNAAAAQAKAAQGQQRADSMVGNAAGVQAGKLLNKFVEENTDGSLTVAPGGEQTSEFLNWSRRFGAPPVKTQNADGTFTYRPPTFGGTGNPLANGAAPRVAAPGAPPAAPSAGGAAAPTTAGGAAPAAAAAPSVPGMAPAQRTSAYRSVFTPPDMPDLPGNVFTSPRYEAAFDRATRDAFSPQALAEFSGTSAVPGMGFGQTAEAKADTQANAAYKKEYQKTYIEPRVDAANKNLAVAQEMLQTLNEQPTTTGAWAGKITDFKAKLAQLGLIDPNSDAYKKIVSGQDLTKWSRQLAASGLKNDFGGRITNMELDQALKSNPNADLTEESMRVLLNMEVQKDAQVLHYASFANKYLNTPGVAPARVNDWYRRYLDPYSASDFKRYAGNINFGEANMPNANGDISVARSNAKGWPLTKIGGQFYYINPATIGTPAANSPENHEQVQVH